MVPLWKWAMMAGCQLSCIKTIPNRLCLSESYVTQGVLNSELPNSDLLHIQMNFLLTHLIFSCKYLNSSKSKQFSYSIPIFFSIPFLTFSTSLCSLRRDLITLMDHFCELWISPCPHPTLIGRATVEYSSIISFSFYSEKPCPLSIMAEPCRKLISIVESRVERRRA